MIVKKNQVSLKKTMILKKNHNVQTKYKRKKTCDFKKIKKIKI